ncbi:MAG: phosphatase PAP2 family protein [Thermoanaerobaculia bacterium]
MTSSPGRFGRIPLAVLFACLLVRPACADDTGSAVLEPSDAPVASEPCSEESAEAAKAEPEAEPPASPPGIGTIALKDAVYILGSPIRWSGKSWLAFTGAAAGVVALGFAFDIPARNKTQGHHTSALDELTKIVEPFGQEYSLAVLGAYGIAGFVFRDAEARDIAIDGALASILASGFITPILKEVIGRARPRQNEGSASFAPFSGNTAFPSGHATQAFAVASVISAHSDQVWVSVTAYTLAGLVGFSRIYHDGHWSSDVAAGALIGTAVGRGIVAFNRNLRASGTTVRVAFSPIVGPHEHGAGLRIQY